MPKKKFKQLCEDKPGDTPCKVPDKPKKDLRQRDLNQRTVGKSLGRKDK